MRDSIFYNIQDKDMQVKTDLCKDAYSKRFKFWVDKLDCNVSIRRQEVKMSFNKIMQKADKNTMFVFIHRWNVLFNPEIHQKTDLFGTPQEYIEVVFRTMTTPDWFLWIYVDIKHLNYFIEKYNLRKLN